jgi:hypothetical protein
MAERPQDRSHPTNPQSGRRCEPGGIDGEELLNNRIDGITIPAPGAAFVETIDIKRPPRQLVSRSNKKCAGRDKLGSLSARFLAKEMTFAGSRIAEKYNIGIISEVGEQAWFRLRMLVRRDIDLPNEPGHLTLLQQLVVEQIATSRLFYSP